VLPALPILPIEPFQLTSFALSLLLVFRTNSSYGRWNEGRRRFGRITTTCRDICRQVSALTYRHSAAHGHASTVCLVSCSANISWCFHVAKQVMPTACPFQQIIIITIMLPNQAIASTPSAPDIVPADIVLYVGI
jgi:hypothetical protein